MRTHFDSQAFETPFRNSTKARYLPDREISHELHDRGSFEFHLELTVGLILVGANLYCQFLVTPMVSTTHLGKHLVWRYAS
jgi:hypothetical protein